jgi:hypothetical protein
VAFLDELWSGIPVANASAIEREHGLAHGSTTLLLVTLPLLAGALVEARLLLWAAGGRMRPWLAGSLAILAACVLASACATAPWHVAAALAVASRPRA